MSKNLAEFVGGADPASVYFETRADWYMRLLQERAELRAALEDCIGELQKESFGMRTRIRALLSGDGAREEGRG